MYFGVDYYPEHWDESVWEPDLRLMKETHFNIVRIAEFAWSRLEPREGEYDFAWLDRLTLCEQHNMLVMMGIPARNVPAWLIKKFTIQIITGCRNTSIWFQPTIIRRFPITRPISI